MKISCTDAIEAAKQRHIRACATVGAMLFRGEHRHVFDGERALSSHCKIIAAVKVSSLRLESGGYFPLPKSNQQRQKGSHEIRIPTASD
jgi:hypothetical protein